MAFVGEKHAITLWRRKHYITVYRALLIKDNIIIKTLKVVMLEVIRK